MNKRDITDIILHMAIAIMSILTIWSMVRLVTYQPVQIGTSHPVRVYAREMETEVHGTDPETDFLPAVHTGGAVISPEEDYYNSLELMARCVEAEAGNQGLEGKRIVAAVILNRLDDPDYPDTIPDVITQPYQFSVYWNGAMEKVEVTEETWTAIDLELEERSYPGVLYFNDGDWPEYGTRWKKVGDHYCNTK